MDIVPYLRYIVTFIGEKRVKWVSLLKFIDKVLQYTYSKIPAPKKQRYV